MVLEKEQSEKRNADGTLKSGVVLNPNGRPKGTGRKMSISQAIQAFLDGEENGKKRLDAAIEKLYSTDLKTCFAYAYGKPMETQLNVTPEDTTTVVELAVARVLAGKVSGQAKDNQNAPETICERN